MRVIIIVACYKYIDHHIPNGIAWEGFVADFEAALWKALKDRFPGTHIQGCVFHWTQVVLRKAQEHGLQINVNT